VRLRRKASDRVVERRRQNYLIQSGFWRFVRVRISLTNMHSLYRFVFFCVAVAAFNSPSVEGGASGDVFTPVIASTLSPEAHPILGTDGVYHVVYELQLTNTKLVPATMQKIEVLAGSTESQVITSFSDAELVKRLRTLAPQPATDATIE